MFFQLFAIGNFGVTTSDLLIIILNNIFLYKFVWEGVELKIPKTSLHLILVLLTFTILLSGFIPLFTIDDGMILQFLKSYTHFIYLYLFLFFALSFEIKKDLIFTSIKIFLFISIFLNIYGIYQLVARAFDLPGGWIEMNNLSLTSRMDVNENVEIKQLALKFKDFYRATSIFSEPSAFVHYNLHNLIFLAIPFLTKTKKFFENRFLNTLLFVLIILNLFLTFSLTAVLGLLFIVTLSVFLEGRKLLNTYLKIFLISSILIVIADYFIQDIVGLSVLSLLGNRIYSVFDYLILGNEALVSGESLTWRLTVVRDSFDVWFNSPLLGNGIGLYSKISNVGFFSDNSFLALLSESGPLSALLFVVLFISIFYHSIKLRFNKKYSKSEISSTLINIVPYIMIVQFETNYLTSNQYLTISFVVPIYLLLKSIQYVYIENDEYSRVAFSEKSLKDRFSISIRNYLKSNSISAQ